MIIPAVLLFIVIIWIKVPALIREKMWGELAAFSGILALAAVLTIAKVLRLPVPNPEHGLRIIFEPVTNYLFTDVLR